MYKLSAFNYIVPFNDFLIVFNSLHGSMLRIENAEIISMFTDKKISSNHSAFKSLLKDRYIVTKDTNEELMADVRHIDRIADKTLALTIIPTYNCNFRCTYCYENSPECENNFPNLRMSEKTAEGIIRYVKKH